MIERQINSLGTITIPKEVRDAFGISGICMLHVGIEENELGEKRIVLSKSNNLDSIVSKFRNLCETLSIVSSCTVALVLGDRVLSMSNSIETQSLLNTNKHINPVVSSMLSKEDYDGSLFVKPIALFTKSKGIVRIFFSYRLSSGETIFFIFFKGRNLEYLVSEDARKQVNSDFGKVRDIINKYEVSL